MRKASASATSPAIPENIGIEALLGQLRQDDVFLRDVVDWLQAPAVPPRYAPFPASLHPKLIEGLQRRGIDQLYTHQAHAIEAALHGESVVVVAGTAGGKSLCFQAPILSELLNNPNARALCLFPTKALSQDQLSHLRSTIAAIDDLQMVNRQSSIVNAYDGDTPQAKRTEIRREARVLITNADMLHIGILPHHTRWASFFKNLKYVVIDELHMYRGIFGSHVANVIRRLKRLCAFYGAQPTFILASATIANPKEHAERLIEAPCTLVDVAEDGSPKGERNIILVNPPMLDAELGLRKSADFVTRDIAARFIQAGAQTICFARSRQATEILLTYLREQMGKGERGKGKEAHVPFPLPPSPSASIMGYRGGYLPEERRAIEKGLREGTVRGVVATNALELGIDIGELDASVMMGYPGTIASFWQQAGRAGRRQKPSAAIMVNTANALDQYLAAHPDYLFKQTPEHARIAPDNLGVLAAHVACAAFEMPFNRGEMLGRAHIDELLSALADEGVLHVSGGVGGLPLFTERGETGDGRRGTGAEPSPVSRPPSDSSRYTWVGDNYPAERVSLRDIGERIVIECEGQVIGETERATAPMRVHLGAIYLHQGETYQVVELDWANGKAQAWKVSSEYYTQASSASEVMVLREFRSEEEERGGVGEGEMGGRMSREEDRGDLAPLLPLSHSPTPSPPRLGEIEVTTRVGRFRQVQFDTHRVIGWGDVDLPAQHLLTVGYWFTIPEEVAKRLDKQGIIALPNDYGPGWQKQRKLARERDGYKCAVCGRPEPPEREHDVHHKKPFRTFGYVRGENENNIVANQLDNLLTVCPECHARIETAQAVNTSLSSLCYLLSQLAPLFVMCDPSDLSAIFEIDSPHTRLPTITLYEMTPGGTGLCEELLGHHDTLLNMAQQRLNECPCERGCPACIGPIDESQPRNVKQDTLKLVDELLKLSR